MTGVDPQTPGSTLERPEYGAAIARFEDLLKRFPNDPRVDVAAYTLGTLTFVSQRYDDATRFALRFLGRLERIPVARRVTVLRRFHRASLPDKLQMS